MSSCLTSHDVIHVVIFFLSTSCMSPHVVMKNDLMTCQTIGTNLFKTFDDFFFNLVTKPLFVYR